MGVFLGVLGAGRLLRGSTTSAPHAGPPTGVPEGGGHVRGVGLHPSSGAPGPAPPPHCVCPLSSRSEAQRGAGHGAPPTRPAEVVLEPPVSEPTGHLPCAPVALGSPEETGRREPQKERGHVCARGSSEEGAHEGASPRDRPPAPTPGAWSVPSLPAVPGSTSSCPGPWCPHTGHRCPVRRGGFRVPLNLKVQFAWCRQSTSSSCSRNGASCIMSTLLARVTRLHWTRLPRPLC